jgi:hypothetical protein
MLSNHTKIKIVGIIWIKIWAKLYWELKLSVQLKIHLDKYLTIQVKYEKDTLKKFGAHYRDSFVRIDHHQIIKIKMI